jgi:hypothetical protein
MLANTLFKVAILPQTSRALRFFAFFAIKTLSTSSLLYLISHHAFPVANSLLTAGVNAC